MVKLNTVIFNKLVAQAEEAKTRGLVKLSEDIQQAIGSEPSTELENYSYSQLRDHVRQDIWKLATRLMTYYNVESIDADKLQHTILDVTAQVIDNLEESLGVEEMIVGAYEPSVPGQVKLAHPLSEFGAEDLSRFLDRDIERIFNYESYRNTLRDFGGLDISGLGSRWLDEKELNKLRKKIEEEYGGKEGFAEAIKKHKLSKELARCVNCGHHKEEHLSAGFGDSEQCQSLVGGGYRSSPKKCDCPGFELETR